jgi:hypothetical protein
MRAFAERAHQRGFVGFRRRIERERISGNAAWQYSFQYRINIDYMGSLIVVNVTERKVFYVIRQNKRDVR